MKKVVIMSVFFSLAVVALLPQPTLAEMAVESNNAAATIVIAGVLVIGAVWLLVSYTRDEGLPVKDPYLSEMRSVSTHDGKLALFQW